MAASANKKTGGEEAAARKPDSFSLPAWAGSRSVFNRYPELRADFERFSRHARTAEEAKHLLKRYLEGN